MAKTVRSTLKKYLIWVTGFTLCGWSALTAQENNIEKQNYSFHSNSSDSPLRLEGESKKFDLDNKQLKSFTNPESVKSLSIKIIESQSFSNLHNMDQTWLTVCQNMGHNASIEPQTLLDNTDFFGSTDLLIISSGVITMPDNRRDIIQQFAEQGGPVYFQSEYSPDLTANQAFETIVNNMGGSFAWDITVEGELNPMNVTGVLSTTPNTVPTLSYFWYGVKGGGDNSIETFLEFQGNYYGFIFTPPNTNYGSMISISDQDWAIQSNEKIFLMENIIIYLASTITGLDEEFAVQNDFISITPNPVINKTTIAYDLARPCNLKISVFDLTGSVVYTLVDEYITRGDFKTDFYAEDLPDGIYFVTLQIDKDLTAATKMVILK